MSDDWVFVLVFTILRELFMNEVGQRIKRIIIGAWSASITIVLYCGGTVYSISFHMENEKISAAHQQYRKEVLEYGGSLAQVPDLTILPRLLKRSICAFWSENRDTILVVGYYVGTEKIDWAVDCIVAYSRLSYDKYRKIMPVLAEGMALERAFRICEILDSYNGGAAYTNRMMRKFDLE